MSQDSRVFFRIFFGIGLVLILISVVIFYNQFTYSKDAIHTEGVIVDTVWHSSHSHRTGKNGSWYPVVSIRVLAAIFMKTAKAIKLMFIILQDILKRLR